MTNLLPAAPWAIITATVEADGPFTSPRNEIANNMLLDLLYEYDVAMLRGTYNAVDQGPSFLVLNIPEKQALELACFFRQESILTQNGLVYVDGRPTVPRDKARDVFGPDAEKEDFYSTLLGSGESFSLGLDWG